MASAEADALPGEAGAIGGAEPVQNGVGVRGPDVAEALDQQEGKAAPGTLEAGRLQPPERPHPRRQMSVQPLRQALADCGPRCAAQAIRDQQLEPRRQRRRPWQQAADRARRRGSRRGAR